MRVKLIGLILLISTLFILCFTEVFMDKYDKATKQSIIHLNEFFEEINNDKLIVDSNDIDTIMKEIDNRLGSYMTKDFQAQLREEINIALEEEVDFKQEPHRFSFFLYNKGDGFRFTKGEVYDRSSWLSMGDNVVGTYVRLTLDDRLRKFDVSTGDGSSSHSILVMKVDGKWQIDIDR